MDTWRAYSASDSECHHQDVMTGRDVSHFSVKAEGKVESSGVYILEVEECWAESQDCFHSHTS